MWFDPRRDGSADVFKLFLCLLPPEEFTKFGYKYQIDPEALFNRMKDDSFHSNFGSLNQDSWDLDGARKLSNGIFELGQEYESWHVFRENLGNNHKKKELWQHFRALAAGINESLEETYNLFWKLRVDQAFRTDAYRKVCQYVNRSNVDKVPIFLMMNLDVSLNC